MTIHIVTDSTSDIPQDVVDSLPIHVVPLYVTLNGVDFLDNIELTRERFYRELPDSDPYPTTATPSTEQFIRVFDEAVDDGATAIISIHVSKSLSATCDVAETAAKNYTRVPVHVVDSGNLSMGEGLIVISAAKAAQANKSVNEVLDEIQSIIKRTHSYAKLDTIDYLLRGGRMSAIQHSIVSILGIKPILKMNNHVSRMEVARTKRKAFERVVNTANNAIPIADMFGITHANVSGQVDELVLKLKERFPDMIYPMVSEVTPALGVHVGPGALCFSWIESSEHYESEKKGLRRWLP